MTVKADATDHNHRESDERQNLNDHQSVMEIRLLVESNETHDLSESEKNKADG